MAAAVMDSAVDANLADSTVDSGNNGVAMPSLVRPGADARRYLCGSWDATRSCWWWICTQISSGRFTCLGLSSPGVTRSGVCFPMAYLFQSSSPSLFLSRVPVSSPSFRPDPIPSIFLNDPSTVCLFRFPIPFRLSFPLSFHYVQ